MKNSSSDSSIPTVKLLRSFNGKILWHQDDHLLGSFGKNLYWSEDNGNNWNPCGQFDMPFKYAIQSLHRLTRRLFRQDVHHAVSLSSNKRFLICAYRGFYLFDRLKKSLKRLPSAWRGNRPLTFCAHNGQVYYGEYRPNPERSPVSVWHSDDDGKCWQAAAKLQSVRHIHGVFHDPYSNEFWVTTGDHNSESAIMRSNDNFKTLEKIISGSQQTRVVQLLFTENHVYYGSDAPEEKNYLYRLSRQDNTVEKLCATGSSVFFGFSNHTGLFFSTAIEPSRTNLSRKSEVWFSANGESWQNILSFQKDFLPMRYFQYGQVQFPSGGGNQTCFWLNPFALEGESKARCYTFDSLSKT